MLCLLSSERQNILMEIKAIIVTYTFDMKLFE
jgi:hypothetical protein